MLHPGRVVEHQSASSCRAGLCVVVRRTRSVECAAVTFCTVFSYIKKKFIPLCIESLNVVSSESDAPEVKSIPTTVQVEPETGTCSKIMWAI